MADQESPPHGHYTRRLSTSSSPIKQASVMSDSSRHRPTIDMERAPSPPPRPTPASRMALSALVNSPPNSPPRSTRVVHHDLAPVREQSLPPQQYYPPASNGHDKGNNAAVAVAGGSAGAVGGSSSYENDRYSSQQSLAQPLPAREEYLGQQRTALKMYPNRTELERALSFDSQRATPVERDVPYDEYEEPQLHPARRTVATNPVSGPSSYPYRSPSPPVVGSIFVPYDEWRNGEGGRRSRPTSSAGISMERRPSVENLPPVVPPTPKNKSLRPDDSMSNNESVWKEALKKFQSQREQEARDIINWRPGMVAHVLVTVEKPPKVPIKRKGWPSDHPTRVAQREARAAAIAAGVELPKKKYKRKSKIGLDDELLGLVEGGDDHRPSSPVPASSIADAEEKPLPEPINLDPNSIIYPCGLTRAEVMAKIEAKDLSGLSEFDVKQVQDEMWLMKSGPAALRKDGTMRKKPGPAKGWKAMRAALNRTDNDGSEAGDTSIAGETVNGDADGDVRPSTEFGTPGASSVASPKAVKQPKPKKRRKKNAVAVADTTIDDIAGSEALDGDGVKRETDDENQSMMDDNGEAATPTVTKKRAKAKEPGVGKGRWTRPSKPDKELVKKAEALAMQQAMQAQAQAQGLPLDALEADLAAAATNPDMSADFTPSVLLPPPVVVERPPNTEDPRGVSEAEAKVRLGLVEELQRQAWMSIVRDVPKIYRVNQAFDTASKQDLSRTAQAAVRNAFSQRNLKPTYRSSTKVNKDATIKAKRIMREMLVYWRKNEKDEVAARKRAEKEALEKAKAEEEAREAKRQSRKLNFLLTQTELYSHFIGKKIKTHEAENMDGAAPHSEAPPAPHGADLENMEEGEPLPDIDYDDDDEENLRRHAAKGAQAAIQAARAKARAFDTARAEAQSGPADALDDDTMDGDELNFQNPSMGEDQVTITQPKMLMAQLKEYQLKGLTWLGNLYEQGINGILADEMGLGKTIQSISLLAYLAEVHNIWGPFLVIAPASTLHNWQQELTRFVPRLKALPYWGSPKDRETLRRIWNRKNLTFNEDSPFHILVTSYQLAVQDEKYFQMMRWQYMILDEAQAIKSSSSARWKSLLSLRCRNRLLLTGTPIQNSMHELWALLHFIMPSLFDSHEEFSEWFSKDIENAASGGNSALKPEQLKRLHMILKPFMLRRVKKHVQKELGDKIEIDVLVDLSQRQRAIYKALRQRVSIADLIAQASNMNDSLGAKNLMNLVMQFRKVCNHPDLFERADVVSPFLFGTFSQSGNLARQGDLLYCPESARNAIEVHIPKLLWTDGGKLDRPGEYSKAGSDTHILHNLFNIWNTEWISSSLKQDESRFAFLHLMGISPAEAHRRATAHPLVKLLQESENDHDIITKGPFIDDIDFAVSSSKRYRPPGPRVPDAAPTGSSLPALRDITSRSWNRSYLSRPGARFVLDGAVAPIITPVLASRDFVETQQRLANDPIVRKTLYGVVPSERDDPIACAMLDELAPGVPPIGLLTAAPEDQAPISSLRVPPIKRLIVDSAKLARLDLLLRELKLGGHRVLLYFQMTKMMDLVEEYLIYRQYKYLRLDGSSPIGERRDMVTSWQTNPDIFVFCLSTRAGGLGINLTAADTVVFYDHDWNPSNDAQAMDRAHRVGQTKQVTVYRLIARGTIEERIVQLARAKKDVQDIVVGTKSLTDVAKPAEIASLFMDDEELAESVAKRKQAEAHGYVAPAFPTSKRSAFGDGLGNIEEDEDDFFSLTRQPANQEDEDLGNADDGGPSGTGTPVLKKRGPKKKVALEGEPPAKQRKAKKVKIALGPDGLPI